MPYASGIHGFAGAVEEFRGEHKGLKKVRGKGKRLTK